MKKKYLIQLKYQIKKIIFADKCYKIKKRRLFLVLNKFLILNISDVSHARF